MIVATNASEQSRSAHFYVPHDDGYPCSHFSVRGTLPAPQRTFPAPSVHGCQKTSVQTQDTGLAKKLAVIVRDRRRGKRSAG
jgi:hypothetical protein